MNAVEIEEAISELASQPFDRNEFAFQFLAAFGNKATTIKRLRAAGGSNASDFAHGILQRNNIHMATCAAGEVDATLKALRDSPKTTSAKAKFILATDGEMLQAEDVTSDDPPIACEFMDFPNHFGFFLPLAGITTVKQIRESSFDIRATGRLNKLYVELLNDNPDWAEPARRPDMNHFMARLIFCFFAEDTDIFNGEGLFTRTVEQMSARDSSDTHEIIGNIFRAMDTKPAERAAANIPPHADGFPYVNGSLFSGSTDAPRFSKIARSFLINIGTLDWKKINPDIFGSMIQAVADDEERGALGMHYTSVPNILKVLNPLFLDDLHAQLETAGENARKLLNLRSRMAKIRVFDPACGSGNFLVIAYKEARAIEAVINERRGELERRSDIPLTNYRGIELRDFPAEIARLALIIAEYQCDVTYRGQKEALAEFLPLDSENWITCGNALRLDWLNICPPTGTGVKVTSDDLYDTPLDQSEIDFENEGGETYICGNPPYLGSKWQSKEQKEDLGRVFDGRIKGWKSLDYVAGAKVVLVGDPEQLQAIEAGAAFRSLAEAHGAVEITEIRRQRDDWQRGATRALATGRTGEAVHAYGDNGMVHSAETREAARAELVEGWDDARNNDPTKSRIILTHTNAEVRDLNIAARDKLRDHGELGYDVDVNAERGERQFASGDRMMFLRNERGMGVKNGTLGTVEQVSPGRMAVRTDDGRSVAFDLKDYAHIDHGYAATFHKSQGVTVDQAHILATPGMDRHSAYVGLTRHRDGAQLHYGRDDFADQSKLVRTLSRERSKDMASDYPLPEAAARGFAERREFRFGGVARDMIAKARGVLADPYRIAALRGRLDKALGREPSAAPDAARDAHKEPGQDRGTDTAASRLRARMAELSKQVRKDDERDRDRTKDRDRDRGGPGR